VKTLSFGVIDLVRQTGVNIPYDGGDCKGDVQAGFVRSTKDNALYVKIVRGSKTCGCIRYKPVTDNHPTPAYTHNP
jgi:hypothetical protein